MRFILIFAASALLAATGSVDNETTWRAKHEASLKAPDGWLAVAGLSWLHDGANTVDLPADASQKSIALRLDHGKVYSDRRPLVTDVNDHPDVLNFGPVSITIIERNGKFGARIRDINAETRRDFTSCKWFPADSAWRIQAKWIAYSKPKTIAIANILGMTDQESSPGYAEFTLQGKTLRLEPIVDDGELFFLFKDTTSAHTTYGAGRFLYAAMPKGNTVELDFNKAHNPPCAFTAYATCPLPPKQNVLPVAIEAGEKRYGTH